MTKLVYPQNLTSISKAVVIPALNPPQRLVELTSLLLKDPDLHIIVVDDGSSSSSHTIFSQLSQLSPAVHILRHVINLGKGQALKTAFNYFLQFSGNEALGVVTADADGQHDSMDIQNIIEEQVEYPHALIIGARSFNTKIPFRSYFGNILTRVVYRLLSGISIKDSQSGLRGIPRKLMLEMMKTSSRGYEFEMEMLIQSPKLQIPIKEVSIKTIYENGNSASHFNPIVDSLKIYFVFVRFCASSLLTVLVDYAVFSIALVSGFSLFASFLVARVSAGSINFMFARRYVFQSKDLFIKQLMLYTLLVLSLMGTSFLLVQGFSQKFHINLFLAKAISEGLLFLTSFAIQNLFVFPKNSQTLFQKTNWDEYYATPKKVVSFTRKFTEKLLIKKFQRYSTSLDNICELGGANSCFYDGIMKKFKVPYTVIDNNTYGLNLFTERTKNNPEVKVLLQDLTESRYALEKNFSIVFSVGLIEHFSPHLTAQVIKHHFVYAKPSALVLITFPTPTVLYLIVRKCLEFLGLWRFYDERPLLMTDVTKEVMKYGELLETFIHWKVFLTQGYVLIRAQQTGLKASTIKTNCV